MLKGKLKNNIPKELIKKEYIKVDAFNEKLAILRKIKIKKAIIGNLNPPPGTPNVNNQNGTTVNVTVNDTTKNEIKTF